MLLRLSLILMLVVPGVAYAEIEQRAEQYQCYVLSNESCERDLKDLAIELCEVSPENFKEIHREDFHMRTNAENSLEEHFIFANWWSLVRVERYTDYNEPATYDRNSDYCYIRVTCLR